MNRNGTSLFENPFSDKPIQWHAIVLETSDSGIPYATAEGRAEAY